MISRFTIEPLSADHDRSGFTCGVDALDRYLREQAGQDVRRRVTSCFVARELPPGLAKRLPRFPTVPVALLGSLAVATPFHGLELGSALLWDAVDRAIRSEVAVYALAVDAKDERAERYDALCRAPGPRAGNTADKFVTTQLHRPEILPNGA
jgi:hypothetical protein